MGVSRRSILALPLLLLSCSGSPEREFAPPAELAGGWKLASQSSVPAAEAPDELREMGVQSVLRARYESPEGTALAATFYRMSAGATAFEAMQKWRPAEGRLALYRGVWFVTLESPDLSHEELSRLAGAMEQHL